MSETNEYKQKESHRILLKFLKSPNILQTLAESCRLLQNLAESYRILQNLVESCRILAYIAKYCRIMQNFSSSCRILQNNQCSVSFQSISLGTVHSFQSCCSKAWWIWQTFFALMLCLSPFFSLSLVLLISKSLDNQEVSFRCRNLNKILVNSLLQTIELWSLIFMLYFIYSLYVYLWLY